MAERGFRWYRPVVDLVDPGVIHGLVEVSVTTLADASHGVGVMDAAIARVGGPDHRVAGPAVTVDVTPGDGLMIRAAIHSAPAGSVVVVNAHGDVERAVLGANVVADMRERGIVACVVDGAVRDVAEMRDADVAVYARGRVARSGTTDLGWGEVNAPIACGGQAVLPGDIVVADDEGVIVVPARDATQVLERALAATMATPKGDRRERAAALLAGRRLEERDHAWAAAERRSGRRDR